MNALLDTNRTLKPYLWSTLWMMMGLVLLVPIASAPTWSAIIVDPWPANLTMLIGSMLALGVANIGMGRITRLPLLRIWSATLGLVLLTFLILAATLLLTRSYYSRSFLLIAASFSVVWVVAGHWIKVWRAQRMVRGLVEVGCVEPPRTLDGIRRTSPVLSRTSPVLSRTSPVLIRIGFLATAPSQAVNEADELLCNEIHFSGRPPVEYSVPVDWTMDPFQDRNWRYKLHSWQPMFALCLAHQHTGDKRYLLSAATLMTDWIASHPFAKGSFGGEWGNYDMAVGKRAAVLGYVGNCLEAEVRSNADHVEAINNSAQQHLDWLNNPKNINWAGNHGLFQLAGLLGLASQMPCLRAAAKAREFADAGLVTCFRNHFTSDGVHREHSPQYHAMMLQLICVLDEARLLTPDSPLAGQLSDGLSKLVWMTHPDGRVASFGDSMGGGYAIKPALSRLSPGLAWLASGGQAGKPLEGQVQFSEEGGLAIARDRRYLTQPNRSSACIMQAAYHSSIHKHADEGTFEWSVQGYRIVVDAGYFAFRYDHPMRQYVTSAAAHNTISLPNRELQYDGPPEADPPKISAATAQKDGFVFGARMKRRLWPAQVDKKIKNQEREKTFLQQDRLICGSVGYGLLVIDHVSGLPPHNMVKQWTHFNPSLKFTQTGIGASADLRAGAVVALPLRPSLSRMDLVRGQTDPELQGWHSPSLNKVVENSAVSVSGTIQEGWLGTALLVGRTAIPALGIRIQKDQVVLTVVDGDRRRPLGTFNAPSLLGLAIAQGERWSVPIHRNSGDWCCDLGVEFDDIGSATPHRGRVLKLGKLAVELVSSTVVIVTAGDERVRISYRNRRLRCRLAWSESDGLVVSRGDRQLGSIQYDGKLPRELRIGETVHSRHWSGRINHLAIRRGAPPPYKPNDITVRDSDLVHLVGVWNNEMLTELQQTEFESLQF